MKKSNDIILIIAIIVIFISTICYFAKGNTAIMVQSSQSKMIPISQWHDSTGSYVISYMEDTKVEYLGSMTYKGYFVYTELRNADGTPKLYKEEVKK